MLALLATRLAPLLHNLLLEAVLLTEMHVHRDIVTVIRYHHMQRMCTIRYTPWYLGCFKISKYQKNSHLHVQG